jgi:thymidylate synthase (FAD)
MNEPNYPLNIYYALEDNIGFVSIVDRMQQDVALKVVNSARISYNTQKKEFDDKDQKLSKYLWNGGHTSPYRHSFYTFHIKSPLFVFRQWWKYQVGSTWREYEVDGTSVSLEVFDGMFDTDKGCSWNEISGRYVEWGNEFYIPKVMRANPAHGNKQASVNLADDYDHERTQNDMSKSCYDSVQTYKYLLSVGVAKEIARMVLPQNMYSEAYWTVSLQGVLHFLEQRLDSHAQYEIQQYAKGIKFLIQPDLDMLGIEL